VNPLDFLKIRVASSTYFSNKQFDAVALATFQWQAKKNVVYKKYISQLGVNPKQVKSIRQIPFLPIAFFKTQKVLTVKNQGRGARENASNAKLFLSSGTTGVVRSKHHVSDVKLYEKSFRKSFELFYGDVKKYYVLSFLPSYYMNKKSSLLYMMNDLMKRSKKKESRFYKKKEQGSLLKAIHQLLSEKKEIILFAVPYALLGLLPSPLPVGGRLIVMETGGMKGRGKEITRNELHEILCKKFGTKKIHSEYGMTELLSQAYSKGDGIFKCPPWMKIVIRDISDPFSFLPAGATGAINIIDLANVNSCSFIATQDVGRIHKGNSFEVLGRIDNSDLRGCNLLSE